jgi:hypothetical protein
MLLAGDTAALRASRVLSALLAGRSQVRAPASIATGVCLAIDRAILRSTIVLFRMAHGRHGTVSVGSPDCPRNPL